MSICLLNLSDKRVISPIRAIVANALVLSTGFESVQTQSTAPANIPNHFLNRSRAHNQ